MNSLSRLQVFMPLYYFLFNEINILLLLLKLPEKGSIKDVLVNFYIYEMLKAGCKYVFLINLVSYALINSVNHKYISEKKIIPKHISFKN